MINLKKVILLISCLLILFVFISAGSAATLNETDMKVSSSAVKNYTDSNAKIPKYVDVSDKNNSMPSYLNTLVTYTLQLNKSNKNPVTIKSVGSPTGPSGTARGTLTKAQYLTVANNIKNFINTNGVAPNYASSALGNIRYESLIYAYACIVNYYHVNGVLPNSVTITHISGVNSAGIIIDNMPPTISNNLASGTYNSIKNVTLTASDSRDPNPKVYYSINNGAWVNKVKTAIITLSAGTTTLKYYALDSKGNPSATITATYTINIATKNITKLSMDDLNYAANSVRDYIEYYHRLPENITISGITLNMAQFLKLASISLTNINNNNTNASIEVDNVTITTSSENITKSGVLNKTNYLSLANSIKSYIDSNGRVPSSQSTSLGNIGYESLVYTFAQILSSYQSLNTLPDFITIRPWSLVSNNRTVFLSMGDIIVASSTLVSHVESQHNLPDFIIISENKVKMGDFLKISLTSLKNLDGKLFQSIILENFSAAANPYESITGGNLLYTDYISLINDVISFMDANRTAPNFKNTIRGAISYQSLVYISAQLLVSTNKNNRLPDYITLIPWKIVQNISTTFISMNLINSIAFYVKNYVSTNHGLPTTLNLSGVIVNMPQFLMLEITSLKNIKDGLYQSIILKSYSNPTSPSENIIAGKISFANYFNAVDTIMSFMNTNGRAPNYSWISQGNMSYYNLIFTYAIILDYYNTRAILPDYVSVNPWTVVSNPNTVSFTETQIMDAAETVEYYIEANHVLPNNVAIGGYNVTMPQFLKLLTTTLHNLNGTYAGQILLGNFGYPTSYSETITGGVLDQDSYLNLARSVEYFMFDGRAPNFQSSNLGNIRFDSLIYMFSQILSSIKKTGELPDFIIVEPWSKISNSSNTFVSVGIVVLFSDIVKYFIENNHVLPTNVTIDNFTISMPQYLKLLSSGLNYINGNLMSNILLENYSSPTGILENIKTSIFDEDFYMSLSNNISTYILTNGKVPSYMVTNLGNISYQSLIYTFSSILSYYFYTSSFPDTFYFNNWSIVSNNNTKFVSIEDILNASKVVSDYIEKFHNLPNFVVINGSNVTMAQYLNLAALALINIDNGFNGLIPIKAYVLPINISENINQTFAISFEDLIDLSSIILEYMDVNGKAPEYQNSTFGKVGFNSLIYIYSQNLRSYQITNQTASFINVIPWNIVTNSSTVFISMEDLKNASKYIQSYVKTNHILPNGILIAGVNITLDEFLILSAKAVIFLKNDININLMLEKLNIHNVSVGFENIFKGDIYHDEILEIADYIVSYSNNNKKIPSNFTNSSLGDLIGFESLVLMFSNIMVTYNTTNANLTDQVTIIPWLAISNPNLTYNFRSNKFFNNLQDAINDLDTIDGDTLWLSKDRYIENVFLNKKLTITSLFDNFVLIEAFNNSSSVFTINENGNGSFLQHLWINGSLYNNGISIINSSNITILECKITNTCYGINIYNSSENIISSNNISNNIYRGISVEKSFNNEIAYNNITNNMFGVYSYLSNNSKIYNNIISRNNMGLIFKNSTGEGHYNIIYNNTVNGLYNQEESIINFTNNWWGSNNPTMSSIDGSVSDICIIGGTLYYDPYLVFSISTSTNRSTGDSPYYEYIVEADLTHNSNGEDCSAYGNIPDDLFVYFNSTNGYINVSTSTINGKSRVKLINTTNGAATVSASFYDYVISKTFNVMLTNSSGVYNTRTGEYFETIQDAISSVNTRFGDTIRVSEGSYYENIIINKKIILETAPGEIVYLYPKKSDQSAITIVSSGSGSVVSGFNIIGYEESYGISLFRVYGCIIKNNNITGFDGNIYLYVSGNNTIQNNNILEGVEGISLIASNNNKIMNNKLVSNENGINIQNSNYNIIGSNELIYNYYGISVRISDNVDVLNNNLVNNWIGVYLFKTDSNKVIGNNFTENGAGLSMYNSIATINSSNSFRGNWLADFSLIDDSEMVMATTVYTCGPSALATLFKKWGIFTTEEEISKLAGTDNEGTSLWGLKNASESKGIPLNAYNVTSDKLSIDNIVLLKINGYNHFELILNITNETITLFDPNLGILTMNWTKFEELYMGIVLVVNGTLTNCTPLSISVMKEIKGLWHYEWRTTYRYHPPKIYWRSIKVSYPCISVKVVWKTGWFGVKYPTLQTKVTWKYYYIKVPYVKNAGWLEKIRYRVKVYDWKDVVNAGKFVYNKAKTYVNNAVKTVTSVVTSAVNTVTKTVTSLINNAEKTINSGINTVVKKYNSFMKENPGWNYTAHLVADAAGGVLISAAVGAAPFTFGASTALLIPGLILSAYGNGLFEEKWNYINVGAFLASSLLSAVPGGLATKYVKISSLGKIPKVTSGTGSTFANLFVNYVKYSTDFSHNIAVSLSMKAFQHVISPND